MHKRNVLLNMECIKTIKKKDQVGQSGCYFAIFDYLTLPAVLQVTKFFANTCKITTLKSVVNLNKQLNIFSKNLLDKSSDMYCQYFQAMESNEVGKIKVDLYLEPSSR